MAGLSDRSIIKHHARQDEIIVNLLINYVLIQINKFDVLTKYHFKFNYEGS